MGIATATILQWAPFVLACLTVPAAYLALREMVGDRMHAAVATLFFALFPRSYEWLISGGGILRALGFLLALLALWQLGEFANGGSVGRFFWPGSSEGWQPFPMPKGQSFSPLEASSFLRVNVAWIGPFGCRSSCPRRGNRDPLARHRDFAAWPRTPFCSSGSRGASIPVSLAELLGLRFTEEAYFSLGALLGVVGMVPLLTRRSLWPLAWLLLIFGLIPAAGPTYGMLPWSVFVAAAILDVIGPALNPKARTPAIAVAATIVLLGSVWSAQLPLSPLRSVPADVRAAMTALPVGPLPLSYLVVSGRDWATDSVSESFPYLTGEMSAATVQGYEFQDSTSWTARLALREEVQACALQGSACLLGLRPEVKFDAVFIPKLLDPDPRDDCCYALRSEIRASSALGLCMTEWARRWPSCVEDGGVRLRNGSVVTGGRDADLRAEPSTEPANLVVEQRQAVSCRSPDDGEDECQEEQDHQRPAYGRHRT